MKTKKKKKRTKYQYPSAKKLNQEFNKAVDRISLNPASAYRSYSPGRYENVRVITK